MWRRFVERFRRLVRAVQRRVMTVSLFLTYVFGMGLTVVFAWIADRELVRERREERDSYWEDAEDYVPDEALADHQS